MNTFQDVIDTFLSSITEFDYLKYTEEELFEELGIKTRVVIAKSTVLEDLYYNPNKEDLNRKINDNELVVLSSGLIVEWLSPRIYNFELLESQMSTKDWTQFSNANRISEIRALRELSKKEFYDAIQDYDFKYADWESVLK